MRPYALSLLMLALATPIVASAAGAKTALIEGIIVSTTKELVTLNSRGRIQKVPRALFPAEQDFRPGTFAQLELPVEDKR